MPRKRQGERERAEGRDMDSGNHTSLTITMAEVIIIIIRRRRRRRRRRIVKPMITELHNVLHMCRKDIHYSLLMKLLAGTSRYRNADVSDVECGDSVALYVSYVYGVIEFKSYL